ncbi:MAG: amino acid ABC transporter substrate-binding protein [Chloroflexi bacterium]|nr:amino acid ABC transporter substrate-binding protein [Chloroflexota bacterium]
MRRWPFVVWSLIFAVVLFIVSLYLGHSEDRAWRRIQSSHVITFAVDASYPPFEALDANGNFIGFDIDLAHEIARRLGARAEFENVAYDGLLGALISDRDDAAISALVEIPERLNEVAYTKLYFNAGIVAVVSRGAVGENPNPKSQIPGLNWAEGKTIAVEYGSSSDALVRQWAKRVTGLTRLSSPSAAEAMVAVERGTAAAALVDAVSAYDFLLGHPALTIAGPPVEDELYVIAVSRQSAILLREINRALDAIETDGTMAELRVRWFGEAAR